jgi:polysaccharide biosynthesis/export protein
MKTLLTSLVLLILLNTASAVRAQTPAAAPAPVALPSQPAPQPVATSGTVAPPASTASPSAPATAAVKAVNVPGDYRLVSGDKLRIEVYKDPQLSQSVQVRPDGKITLPLANDIMAAGRTPSELRDSIVTSLKTYMSSPTVTVMVVETVPPVVYVMGEVNAAGPIPLTGRLDMMQALAMARGFKDFANTKKITVRRGTQTLKFNYNDALKGNASPLYLQPGDIIIVP